MINVKDILDAKGSTSVFTIAEQASLSELVSSIFERKVGALIVTDQDGKPTGIVSERDIIRPCHEKADFDAIKVADIMTRNLITVHAGDDVNIAMDLMVSKKIRHLPVVSDSGIEGIITVRDLLHAMREADKEDVQSLVDYLQGAIEERTGSDATE